MNEPSVSVARLDYLMKLLADLKKTVVYDKNLGTWAWVDSDCIDSVADYHTGFLFWIDAVVDALEPYLD